MHDDPTDLVGAAEREGRAKDKARAEREQLINDLRSISKHDASRRVFWWLLSATGLFHSAPGDALELAFREGKRHVGIMLLTALGEADPELLIHMMKGRK